MFGGLQCITDYKYSYDCLQIINIAMIVLQIINIAVIVEIKINLRIAKMAILITAVLEQTLFCTV